MLGRSTCRARCGSLATASTSRPAPWRSVASLIVDRGDKISVEVTEVVEHRGATIVGARYDGLFDRSNLTGDLILTNYFTIRDAKIVTLIVIYNTPAY